MKQAQRAYKQADTPLAHAETERATALDDRSVLDMLEADAREDEDAYEPVTGIRNGLLIGLGFWAIVLAALGITAGLGYL